MSLVERINRLKREKNAVILAHNYQRPEIYDVADALGDSLDLAKAAIDTDAEIIVFCGVDFMAESAKLLNPDKKVLLPALSAKCPMAAMATAKALREQKTEHPNAGVVCYINTSAEVKAESDICCTSANAALVANSLPQQEVIFLPDKHLAEWVEQQTGKRLIKWPGFCHVHANIRAEDARKAKDLHPQAALVAHPECPLEVLELADKVCGTQGMLGYAKESPAKEFIVATEEGMVNRLKREVPGKAFYSLGGTCTAMKKITMDEVLASLEHERFEVTLDEATMTGARKALDRMMAL